MEIFVNYIKSIKETKNAWGESIVEPLPKINTTNFKIDIDNMTLKELLHALRFTIPIKDSSNVSLHREDNYTVIVNNINEYNDCEKHYFIFHTLTEDVTNDCMITNVEKYRGGKLIRNYDYTFLKYIFKNDTNPENILLDSGVLDFVEAPLEFKLVFKKNEFRLIKENVEYRVHYKGYKLL